MLVPTVTVYSSPTVSSRCSKLKPVICGRPEAATCVAITRAGASNDSRLLWLVPEAALVSVVFCANTCCTAAHSYRRPLASTTMVPPVLSAPTAVPASTLSIYRSLPDLSVMLSPSAVLRTSRTRISPPEVTSMLPSLATKESMSRPVASLMLTLPATRESSVRRVTKVLSWADPKVSTSNLSAMKTEAPSELMEAALSDSWPPVLLAETMPPCTVKAPSTRSVTFCAESKPLKPPMKPDKLQLRTTPVVVSFKSMKMSRRARISKSSAGRSLVWMLTKPVSEGTEPSLMLSAKSPSRLKSMPALASVTMSLVSPSPVKSKALLALRRPLAVSTTSSILLSVSCVPS